MLTMGKSDLSISIPKNWGWVDLIAVPVLGDTKVFWLQNSVDTIIMDPILKSVSKHRNQICFIFSWQNPEFGEFWEIMNDAL